MAAPDVKTRECSRVNSVNWFPNTAGWTARIALAKVRRRA